MLSLSSPDHLCGESKGLTEFIKFSVNINLSSIMSTYLFTLPQSHEGDFPTGVQRRSAKRKEGRKPEDHQKQDTIKILIFGHPKI